MEKKKDGIREIGTKPFRQYYDITKTDFKEVKKSLIKTVGYWSHKDLVIEKYKESQGFVKWHCYTCRQPINIDIMKFDNKSIFCDSHKPKIFTNEYKTDLILMRYINSLFTHIKNKISDNSDTKLYG